MSIIFDFILELPKHLFCCKRYNKIAENENKRTSEGRERCNKNNIKNKKLEQGENRDNVVKITSIKLYKSIAFLTKIC